MSTNSKAATALLGMIFTAVAGIVSAAPLESVVGVASVIDGDTIEIHGTQIRLYGIDAPERGQLCQRPTGENWRCGQIAALELVSFIDGAPITCTPNVIDRHGRLVAVCSAAGHDLNARMVAEGWAVAYRQYSKDYIPLEEDARSAKKGIWSGSFVMPWEWRRGVRVNAKSAAPEGGLACAIKGNINSRGDRITTCLVAAGMPQRRSIRRKANSGSVPSRRPVPPDGGDQPNDAILSS